MLLCGSVGGLKDGIGTSGYVIHREGYDEPVMRGYTAEQQRGMEASSTRQELLAQLCIEYGI